jgi:hypothetical protein
MELPNFGSNVHVTTDGKVTVITVDMSKVVKVSESGKSSVIGTTNGNKTLPCGAKLGVNIYRAI